MEAKLLVGSNKPELSSIACSAIAEAAAESIARNGIFTVALSGGSMPSLLSPLREVETDWSKWHIFFSDERCVPLEHPDSNFRANFESFLGDRVPRSQIHAIAEEGSPELIAELYEQSIRQVCGDGLELDLVLLGIGPDGHTASLFPAHPLLTEPHNGVVPITDSPKPPSSRITFTLALINQSRDVAFITTGDTKASVLARALVLGTTIAENEFLVIYQSFMWASVRHGFSHHWKTSLLHRLRSCEWAHKWVVIVRWK